jgi:HEAT repeat protein
MPSGRETAESWASSVSDWEAAIADPARPFAAAPGIGPPPGPRDAYRTAIYGLFALVAFLIALVGAVLVARQLRPLVSRGRPVPTAQEQSLEQLEAAGDQEARLEAARKVVALGPAAVAAALDRFTAAGSSGDLPSIPQPIVHALAEVGPDAADALRQALGAPTARVRAAAAEVLAELGAQGAVARPALVAALADKNDWVRWYAVEALGNMGAEASSAVDALAALLKHSDALTRRRAIEALGRIGPPASSAAAALEKARQHDPDEAVRKAAAVALYQVHLVEQAEKAKLRAVTQVRELVRNLASGDQFTAVAAAKKLGEWGVTADSAVPALALALRYKRAVVREAAAQALGSMGDSARDVRPALQAAAHEADPAVRAAARKALEQIEAR